MCLVDKAARAPFTCLRFWRRLQSEISVGPRREGPFRNSNKRRTDLRRKFGKRRRGGRRSRRSCRRRRSTSRAPSRVERYRTFYVRNVLMFVISVFVPGKPLQPSLMNAGKEGTYLSEAPFRCSILG
jgi:hypothetical protein